VWEAQTFQMWGYVALTEHGFFQTQLQMKRNLVAWKYRMTSAGPSEKDEAVITNVEIKLAMNKLNEGQLNVKKESDVVRA
jgi:hypothetical protein